MGCSGVLAIVRRARQIGADLIVASCYAGRHTVHGLMRLTDWALVRLSPTPVLLVNSPYAYRHPAVLVAIDPRPAFAKPMQLDKIILDMRRLLSESLVAASFVRKQSRVAAIITGLES